MRPRSAAAIARPASAALNTRPHDRGRVLEEDGRWVRVAGWSPSAEHVVAQPGVFTATADAHLAVRPGQRPAEPIAAIVKRHKAQLQEAEARLGGTDKYAMIRAAQVKRCTQLLAILDRFGG